jgi:L-amino acid N-acyltransferase
MPIRDATETDLPALLELHNGAVRNGNAAWTEKEDSLADRAEWLSTRKASGFPVVVACNDAGEVLGYGAYGSFRGRDGYRDTVEHSIYIFPKAQGQGVGKALLTWLIDDARQKGRHVMVAAIDSANDVSIRMHERFGFVHCGKMPEVGQKRGRWLDLVLMGLILDERKAP